MTEFNFDVTAATNVVKHGGQILFVDVSGTVPSRTWWWSPVKISKEEIDAEVERLTVAPAPPGGRRASLLVHPESTATGLALAPGIDVAIEVLKPEESTTPVRQNAAQVQICIQGEGVVAVAGVEHRQQLWDVCTIPSMKPYAFRNEGSNLWVRLSFSNAPLLAKLGVHMVEDTETVAPQGHETNVRSSTYVREKSPDIPIGTSGARLRGYEHLVDIEVVANPPLHWPWAEVEPHLAQEVGDGKRRFMVLYNPATERRSGATHSFFVTAQCVPPGTPARPVARGHRHNSVAISYHFRGSGTTIVEGQEIKWKAGDLLLSAPGWAEHAHYHGPDGFCIFTVQDHPLHIGMESLCWQEDMDGPVLTLGSEAGQTGFVGPGQTSI